MVDTALMQLTHGRPTLRCLVDDIAGRDWTDATHSSMLIPEHEITVPMHALSHPIVGKAAGVFFDRYQDADILRENISTLTDPPFWKVKVQQWRGAVWIDEGTGQAWLVAAGLRRGKAANDFYQRFMADIESKGAAYFMPTQDDRDILARELKERLLAEWETGFSTTVRSVAAGLLASAGGVERIEVGLPGAPGKTFSWVEIEVEFEDIDGEQVADVVVTAKCLDYGYLALFQWAQIAALLAVDPHEQTWSALPADGCEIASSVYSGNDLTELRNHLATEVGMGEVISGDVAHFSHRSRLTESTVEGLAVKAVCGTWFVPRQDHDELSVCAYCDAIWRVLPEDPVTGVD